MAGGEGGAGLCAACAYDVLLDQQHDVLAIVEHHFYCVCVCVFLCTGFGCHRAPLPGPHSPQARVRVLASADAGSVPLHAAHMVAEHDAWHMEAREGA